MVEYFTTAQVAAELGVSVFTIARWVREGKLQATHQLPGRTGTYLFHPSIVSQAKEARNAKTA